MAKYVIKRKDVCAGRLVQPIESSILLCGISYNQDSIDDMPEMCGIHIKKVELQVLRGMLFSINDEGLTEDLIYTTPNNYPIPEYETVVLDNGEAFVDNMINLDEILKFMNYKESLTQRDLKQIFRRLVLHRWWLWWHIREFGWKINEAGHVYNTGNGIFSQDDSNRLHAINNSAGKGKPHPYEVGYERIRKR